VFEYTRGMHQKVMIVDGIWASVGSANFDPRSFRINDEINVAICDAEVAAELRRAFERDLVFAEEWTRERWKARPFPHVLHDWFGALFKREL